MWQMEGGSLSLYAARQTPAEHFGDPEEGDSLYHKVRLKELLGLGH